MRNTIISSIRQGIRNAIESVVSALAPIFYWPGTHTLEATTGTDPTFTRATAATFEDFEGVIRTVESSEPRFQGARRVENLMTINSEDITVAGYTKGNGAVASNATTMVYDGTPNGYIFESMTVPAKPLGSGSYRVSADMALVSGSPTSAAEIDLRIEGSAALTQSKSQVGTSLTSTVQRITAITANSTGTSIQFAAYSQVAATLTLTNIMVEWIPSSQTNQNPSEYVSTGVATGPELASNVAADWIPNGGGSAVQDGEWIVITGAGAHTTGVSLPIPTVNGGTYLWSMEVELLTATAFDRSISVITAGGGDAFTPSSYSLISSSQTVTYSGVCTDATSPSYIIAHPRGVGLTARIRNVSVKQAEHGANVDGVQYFNTLNANTVTANVVTEAVGSPLTRANTQFGDLGGISGVAPANYVSTPNVVTTWPELDLRARIAINAISGFNFFINKNNMFSFAMRYDRLLRLYVAPISGTGVNSYSTVALPASIIGVTTWFRATFDAATGDVKFFTADGSLEAPAISDYVQLGTTINNGLTDIRADTSEFTASVDSIWYPLYGNIYRSQVYNEIDGTTPVVDFTPGSYVSGSTFVSSTSGETWTLEGNASIFQPPVDASGPFGYLAEKASTNLALQSEDFSNASWIGSSGTVPSTTAIVAPDGTQTGNLAITAVNLPFNRRQGGLSSAGYAPSFFAKAQEYSFVFINNDNGVGWVCFDLATETITSGNAGFTGEMTPAGNGWYRCKANFPTGVAGNNAQFMFGVRENSGGNYQPASTANGTSGAYIWGAQVELGTYPTSYIPTTTTAVTRNADVLTVAESGAIDYTIGTLSLEASRAHSVDAGNSSIIGTGGFIMYSVTGITDTTNNNSGVTGVSGVSRLNNPVQSAIVWGGSAKDVYHGVATASGSFAAPLTSGDLIVGGGAGGASGMMSRNLKIFNTELTAEEVGDL